MTNKFTSPTCGQVDIDKMINIMRSFYEKNKHYESPFHVIIGTDSQNFDKTKIVTVCAMQCESHGGIYFYRVEKVERIQNVMAKLNYETQLSLDWANKILSRMTEIDEELFDNISFAIHIDAGHNPKGKTKELIPSLVGWINSCGYSCEVKPTSWCASTIANRISK